MPSFIDGSQRSHRDFFLHFSADHPGVPNARLVAEKHKLADTYKGVSVAEQNSVDLAWNLLMQPQYKDLLALIAATPEEVARFRQLVVNVVLATDIVDKQLCVRLLSFSFHSLPIALEFLCHEPNDCAHTSLFFLFDRFCA